MTQPEIEAVARVEQVTPQMNEAWCAFEPVGQFKETMSFARFNGMMRHAFMSGFLAARHREAALASRQMPGREKVAIEALRKIANNNWRDQSRAKTVAREALALFDSGGK